MEQPATKNCTLRNKVLHPRNIPGSSRSLELVEQLCLTLCNLMDYSPPGCFLYGDTPGKNTGVVAILFSRDLCITGKFFAVWATREAKSIPRGHLMAAQTVFWISLESCAWWDFQCPLLYLWSLTRHHWWTSLSHEGLPRLSLRGIFCSNEVCWNLACTAGCPFPGVRGNLLEDLRA